MGTRTALVTGANRGLGFALIDNAGILPEATAMRAASPVDSDLFRRTFETNVFGAVRMIQEFHPLLERSPRGHIVNVSSTMGSLADQTDPQSPYYGLALPAYQSSKGVCAGTVGVGPVRRCCWPGALVAQYRMRPFEEIVDEHGAVVLRVLRSYLAPADADDAWSDTFLAAMQAYPRIRPDSNVRAWLATIARRKAIDRLRATRPTPMDPAHLPEATSPNGIPEPADACLAAALARLTARQRDAIVYHHVAGLPYAQVGELLGSSESAARRSASDGLAALRATYRGDGSE